MTRTQSPILWDGEDLVPWHINVETVFGCNSRCTMCVIDQPTRRKKGVMAEPLYRRIVDSLAEHCGTIRQFDFIGLGEPLLDPNLAARVAYAKGKGINGTAIATNADLLDAGKAAALLDAGIDTVIFSIDGTRAETHEAIRRGVSFERVKANAERIVRLRDEGGYATKFVFRFIRQDSNEAEWPEYERHWRGQVDPGRDLVMCYGRHNWGGTLCSREELVGESAVRAEVDRLPCHWVFDTINIRKDGEVVLCCEDALDPQYDFGNAAEVAPLEAFNCKAFKAVRRLHVQGRKNAIPMCRECTVPYSEYGRIVSSHDDDK